MHRAAGDGNDGSGRQVVMGEAPYYSSTSSPAIDGEASLLIDGIFSPRLGFQQQPEHQHTHQHSSLMDTPLTVSSTAGDSSHRSSTGTINTATTSTSTTTATTTTECQKKRKKKSKKLLKQKPSHQHTGGSFESPAPTLGSESTMATTISSSVTARRPKVSKKGKKLKKQKKHKSSSKGKGMDDARMDSGGGNGAEIAEKVDATMQHEQQDHGEPTNEDTEHETPEVQPNLMTEMSISMLQNTGGSTMSVLGMSSAQAAISAADAAAQHQKTPTAASLTSSTYSGLTASTTTTLTMNSFAHTPASERSFSTAGVPTPRDEDTIEESSYLPQQHKLVPQASQTSRHQQHSRQSSSSLSSSSSSLSMPQAPASPATPSSSSQQDRQQRYQQQSLLLTSPFSDSTSASSSKSSSLYSWNAQVSQFIGKTIRGNPARSASAPVQRTPSMRDLVGDTSDREEISTEEAKKQSTSQKKGMTTPLLSPNTRQSLSQGLRSSFASSQLGRSNSNSRRRGSSRGRRIIQQTGSPYASEPFLSSSSSSLNDLSPSLVSNSGGGDSSSGISPLQGSSFRTSVSTQSGLSKTSVGVASRGGGSSTVTTRITNVTAATTPAAPPPATIAHTRGRSGSAGSMELLLQKRSRSIPRSLGSSTHSSHGTSSSPSSSSSSRPKRGLMMSQRKALSMSSLGSGGNGSTTSNSRRRVFQAQQQQYQEQRLLELQGTRIPYGPQQENRKGQQQSFPTKPGPELSQLQRQLSPPPRFSPQVQKRPGAIAVSGTTDYGRQGSGEHSQQDLSPEEQQRFSPSKSSPASQTSQAKQQQHHHSPREAQKLLAYSQQQEPPSAPRSPSLRANESTNAGSVYRGTRIILRPTASPTVATGAARYPSSSSSSSAASPMSAQGVKDSSGQGGAIASIHTEELLFEYLLSLGTESNQARSMAHDFILQKQRDLALKKRNNLMTKSAYYHSPPETKMSEGSGSSGSNVGHYQGHRNGQTYVEGVPIISSLMAHTGGAAGSVTSAPGAVSIRSGVTGTSGGGMSTSVVSTATTVIPMNTTTTPIIKTTTLDEEALHRFAMERKKLEEEKNTRRFRLTQFIMGNSFSNDGTDDIVDMNKNQVEHEKSQKRVRRCLLVLLAFAVIGIVVGVTVATTTSRDSSSSDDVGPEVLDEGGTDDLPTSEPTTSPTFLDANVLELALKVTRELLDGVGQTVHNVFDDTNTNSSSFDIQPGSVQWEAVGWISTFDSVIDTTDQALFAQRYALVVLNFALNGGDWERRNTWLNPDLHECLWETTVNDIVCNARGQMVGVEFEEKNFEGAVPFELGLLSNLQSLNFSGNPRLRGQIPTTLCPNLANLRRLHFDNCDLTGRLPDNIGSCSLLDILEVGRNALTGTLPISLLSLSRLRTLDLGDNQLNGGLPQDWSLMRRLESLDIGRNLFTGSLPNAGIMSNLKMLIAAGNKFDGQLPDWLDIDHLTRLDLSENQLTGSISELPQFTDENSLEVLNLSGNGLTGTVPVSLGRLQSLETLAIANNKFVGEFPALSSSLLRLDIANNGFMNEELPPMSNVFFEYYNVSNNDFGGMLPSSLFRFPNLLKMDLSNNPRVSGSIPSDVSGLSSIKYFRASNCSLSGTIPSEVAQLSQVQWLDLGFNQLSGSIPSKLDMLDFLETLQLSSNDLTGSIPLGFGFSSLLRSLDLSANRLTGRLPNDMKDVVNLEFLSLRDNPGLIGAVSDLVCSSRNVMFDHAILGCGIQCIACCPNTELECS